MELGGLPNLVLKFLEKSDDEEKPQSSAISVSVSFGECDIK